MVTVVSIVAIESLARVLLALWWRRRSVLRWRGLVVVLVAKSAKPSTLVILGLLLAALVVVVVVTWDPSCAVHGSQAATTTATVADARPYDEEGDKGDQNDGG